MMTQHALTAVYQPCGDWWAAWVEELPGANSQGRTLDEARANLREAAQMILEEGGAVEEAEHEAEIGGCVREQLFVTA